MANTRRIIAAAKSAEHQYSCQQVENPRSCLHRMHHELVAAVKYKHYGLTQALMRLEAKSQLPCRALIVKLVNPGRPSCGLNRILEADSMF